MFAGASCVEGSEARLFTTVPNGYNFVDRFSLVHTLLAVFVVDSRMYIRQNRRRRQEQHLGESPTSARSRWSFVEISA